MLCWHVCVCVCVCVQMLCAAIRAEIAAIVKEWLKHARDREGGRARRTQQKRATAVAPVSARVSPGPWMPLKLKTIVFGYSAKVLNNLFKDLRVIRLRWCIHFHFNNSATRPVCLPFATGLCLRKQPRCRNYFNWISISLCSCVVTVFGARSVIFCNNRFYTDRIITTAILLLCNWLLIFCVRRD